MIEPHPISLKVPPMSALEYNELRHDMAKNGLLDPITLYEGKILDGRHRHQGCLDTGIKPVFEEYTGDDPLGFVLSKNLHRRSLSAGQRRELAKEYLRDHSDKSDRAIAKETGVRRETVAAVRSEIAEETKAPEDANGPNGPLAEKRERQASATSDELPAEPPPPRIERGLKKDGTPRKARGRKPGTAATPKVPAEPVPAESEHEDHTHLMSRRDLWMVETTWIFSEHLDDALHAIVTIISDRRDEIAKIHEIKRQGLVRSFAYALWLKIAD